MPDELSYPTFDDLFREVRLWKSGDEKVGKALVVDAPRDSADYSRAKVNGPKLSNCMELPRGCGVLYARPTERARLAVTRLEPGGDLLHFRAERTDDGSIAIRLMGNVPGLPRTLWSFPCEEVPGVLLAQLDR